MLKPCPDSPNCVSSRAAPDTRHHVAPLTFQGDADAARQRLLEVLVSLPRTTVVARERGYIRAEFRSRIFGFVDDVEFVFPESMTTASTTTVHVRSASRSGHYDFGVNRRRVETLRRRFAQASP